MQNPNRSQNPKSEIQDPNGRFGAATKRTDTTTIQNPRSKIQNPNRFGFWILGGHVANEDVWLSLQSLSALLASSQARGQKVPSSIPSARAKLGTNFQTMLLLETELPCHGNQGPLSRETVGNCDVARGPP